MPERLMPHPDELIDHEAEHWDRMTREHGIRVASFRVPDPDEGYTPLPDEECDTQPPVESVTTTVFLRGPYGSVEKIDVHL